MHRGSITIVCHNQLDRVEKVHQMACDFCQLHQIAPRALHALTLTLDEVLTNILCYAYPDEESHEITVRIDYEPNLLTVAVEDDGKEFNPLSFPVVDVSKPLAEREPGGLGIHLIRSLMNEVHYQRVGDKNVLTMKKTVRDSVKT